MNTKQIEKAKRLLQTASQDLESVLLLDELDERGEKKTALILTIANNGAKAARRILENERAGL